MLQSASLTSIRWANKHIQGHQNRYRAWNNVRNYCFLSNLRRSWSIWSTQVDARFKLKRYTIAKFTLIESSMGAWTYSFLLLHLKKFPSLFKNKGSWLPQKWRETRLDFSKVISVQKAFVHIKANLWFREKVCHNCRALTKFKNCGARFLWLWRAFPENCGACLLELRRALLRTEARASHHCGVRFLRIVARAC